MLHRVPVDVIKMSLEIVFVLKRVLPELSLPDATTSMMLARGRNPLLRTATGQISFREFLLDPGPTTGIFGISGGERPDRMQVIWQQHNGLNCELPLDDRFSKNVAEQPHGGNLRKDRSVAFRLEGEEIHSPRYEGSSIVGHEDDVFLGREQVTPRRRLKKNTMKVQLSPFKSFVRVIMVRGGEEWARNMVRIADPT